VKNPASVFLCLSFALIAAVPAGAATITVAAGGDLQAAVDAAKPGDTILLQAGATFNGVKLPAKGGSAFITIRSSAADSSLPPAGQRMDPKYASLLPKIRSTTAGPAIRTSAGATYWRLQFLEFLPASSSSSVNLVEFGAAGTSQNTLSLVPQHLVIDRCYLHGDASFGQRRGLALNSGDTQVLNSYFRDFKGVSQDTQAIAGWNGPGPYLIENNYIEAAGENILFGGSDPNIPNLVPSNITIRRNQITKQTAWMTQSWTVKNLLEFKNAANVTVEGNIIENNWAAGQQGYSILFTPRNQSGTAPWTIVKNVTIRSNIIRHVAAVFNICGYDNLATSQQTQNISIVNNLMYDISTRWSIPNHPANGWMAVIGGGPKDITFDHNTVDNDGTSTIQLYQGYAPTGYKIYGFELKNNLLRDNKYGVFGANSSEGTATFNMYTPGWYVQANTFAGGSLSWYPAGNDFPTLAQWLADFASASTGNYQLDSTSQSNNAATDGTDIGVNFTTLNAALAGSTASPTPPPPPPPTSTGSTSPYTGTAVSLPGTVQFENYDIGGADVAYHDTTSGNSGGVYRNNSVDLQVCSDTGGGYNLGWTKAGEWLIYSVNVTASGTYSVDVRAASNGTGGTLHIEVDGVDKTGTIAIPNTGGWQVWKTITKTGVALTAGKHTVRVVMDSNGPTGSVANLNWFAVR
jgi:hypothetical protein